ncbi:MAG: hypothetical protein ACK5Z5_00560 [Neisseriaceae bacterium]
MFQQMSFSILLKIDRVDFKWVISKNTVKNYLASVNFYSEKENQSEDFFDQLIIHELTKILFLELKSLFRLSQLEFMGFEQVANIKNEQDKLIKHLELPLIHLFGDKFNLMVNNNEEMDFILKFIGYRPLQLNKYVTPRYAQFACWNDKYSIILESKVVKPVLLSNNRAQNNGVSTKNYIKLTVLVDNIQEYVFIESKLLKYIVFKYNGITQFVSQKDFEYNQFFTEFSLEILQMALTKLHEVSINIIDWKYSHFPQYECLQLKIIAEKYTGFILIPNLNTSLISLLNINETDSPIEYLISDDYTIKIPVVCSKISVNLDEMEHLKVGDVLLLDKDIDRPYLLDFKSSSIVANLKSDSQLEIIGKWD